MRDNLGADIEARRAKTDVQLLLHSRYAELGKMTGHEYAVLALFLLLVVLWLTRSPGFVPGWADMLPQPGVGDATPAVLVALLMFAVPAGPGGTPLLTWNLVQGSVHTWQFFPQLNIFKSYLWWLFWRCGGSLVAHQTSEAEVESGFRIRHLPQ